MSVASTSASEDPTHTKSIRRKYAQRLRAPFGRIITEINDGVKYRDVFGLRDDSGPEALATPLQPYNFPVDNSAEMIESFEDWMDRQIANDVLTTVRRDDNQYIQSTTESAIRQAEREAKAAGWIEETSDVSSMFNLPIHRNKVQQLYSRNFQELRGISEATAQQTRRVLADGLVEGTNPNQLARDLTDRVDKIGRTRATAMAQTETIHAHAEGKLDTYERLGVEEVVGSVEIATANDRHVCDECKDYVDATMSISDARGLIPVHVRCRCTWKPKARGFT